MPRFPLPAVVGALAAVLASSFVAAPAAAGAEGLEFRLAAVARLADARGCG